MLADGLIMLLVYVWARTNPDVVVSFLFGLKFKAAYFPWVLIGFKTLLGGAPIMDVLGAIVGHLYIYLKDIYPAVAGKHYLNAPQFLYVKFEGERGEKKIKGKKKRERKRGGE
eukprot:Phypoly_transcript_23470.p1 GENE.Phypoly_transcript_23470~~Phypoly_transcript_23470.p1  ORF type:complete len:113 (+),score=15.64 Phypoly_transcript_23470:93-431(+)